MNTLRLKDALAKALENCRVKAALFTTFNFEPRFFENYVLPLLVPQEPFGQNELNNNIRWRILYRQKGKVPPVTVYVDQYAKSNADAPLLDYTVHAIAMPGKGQNRGAFHPKTSFFLAEKNQQEVLVVLCGSGNLTEAGWCKNVEGFTILILEPNVFYPHTLHDAFINLLSQFSQLLRKSERETETEQLIIGFFAKRNRTNDTSCLLYHAGQESFQAFLQQAVFNTMQVQCVEVFSPYFNSHPTEAQWLKERCTDVRIQLPLLGEYCTLGEPALTAYTDADISWYLPPPVVDRWCHSKVYRFISTDETITIIGSINLTTPGWAGLTDKAEVANMEVALLLREKTNAPQSLLQKRADLSQLKYLSGFEEGEDAPSAFMARYETPDIRFTIDWTNGTLSWETYRLKNPCSLKLPDRLLFLNGNDRQVSLKDNTEGRRLLKVLARNSLLQVIETLLGQEISHYYYPLQVGFAMKPFAFPFKVEDILVLWDELGKDKAITDEQLTRHIERLTETVVDESGAICRDGYVQSSLLNENARHLSSLIRLEKFLFKAEQEWNTLPYYRKERCAQDVRYYLLANNINTLPAYLEQLEQEPLENKGRAGFLFVLLTILENRFYNWKQLSGYLHKDYFNKEELKESKQAFDGILTRLQVFNQEIGIATQMSPAKLDWFTKKITA